MTQLPNQEAPQTRTTKTAPLAASPSLEQPLSGIRVLIVDLRKAPRSSLEFGPAAEPTLHVVGRARTMEEGLYLLSDTAPQVALLAMDTLDAGELEQARKLCQGQSQPSVITLVPQEDETHVYQSIALGASACLPSTTPWEYLLSTIQRVAAGERPIQYSLLGSAAVAARVLRRFSDLPPQKDEPDPACPLSPRERQVVQEIARGRSNKEIGKLFGIGEQTVKNHVTAILQKLGANDRAHAAIMALRNGWISAG